MTIIEQSNAAHDPACKYHTDNMHEDPDLPQDMTDDEDMIEGAVDMDEITPVRRVRDVETDDEDMSGELGYVTDISDEEEV